MVDVKRYEYKRALKWGFKPKNKVQRSNSGKHYYLTNADFNRYEKVVKGHVIETVR